MKMQNSIVWGLSLVAVTAIVTTGVVAYTLKGATATTTMATLGRLAPYKSGADKCGLDDFWNDGAGQLPGGSGDRCQRKVGTTGPIKSGFHPLVVPNDSSANACAEFKGQELRIQSVVNTGKGVSAIRTEVVQARYNTLNNNAANVPFESGTHFQLFDDPPGSCPDCDDTIVCKLRDNGLETGTCEPKTTPPSTRQWEVWTDLPTDTALGRQVTQDECAGICGSTVEVCPPKACRCLVSLHRMKGKVL